MNEEQQEIVKEVKRLKTSHDALLAELKGLAIYLQMLENNVAKAGATEQLNRCLIAIAKAEGSNETI